MYDKEIVMLNFNYVGIPLTHQKVTPGNTITSLSAYCYKYGLWVLNFDDADAEIVVGDWVVGATSAAAAKVMYVTSTAWTNGVGYALIDSWNGVAWTNDEEIKVAAGATMANVNQAAAIVEATDAQYDSVYRLQWKGMLARFAQVICFANTILCGINGGKPDQTALIGIPLTAGSGLSLQDNNAIAKFKCVDYVAQSAGIAQVEFFF